MKNRLMMIAGALVASLLCLPAMAQPAPDTAGTGQGMAQGNGTGPAAAPAARHRPPRDCAMARNPAACNAQRAEHAKMREACKEMRGPQRQQCMQEQMQKVDCSTHANPQRCEARKQAAQACKGESGAGFRQCLQQKMPPVDCSTSPNPARCEQHQKARLACQDKQGPEHKACLRQQFNAKQ